MTYRTREEKMAGRAMLAIWGAMISIGLLFLAGVVCIIRHW